MMSLTADIVKPFALATIVVLGATLAPGNGKAASSVAWEGDRLRFSGALDERSAEILIAELKKKPSLLMIASSGGRGSSAIEVGKVVKAQGIPVVVFDYCLSACANGVFLASPQPMILGAGVIGFHGSAVAEVSAYRAAAMPVPPQELRWMDEYSGCSRGAVTASAYWNAPPR